MARLMAHRCCIPAFVINITSYMCVSVMDCIVGRHEFNCQHSFAINSSSRNIANASGPVRCVANKIE